MVIWVDRDNAIHIFHVHLDKLATWPKWQISLRAPSDDAYFREQRSSLMPEFTLDDLGKDRCTIKHHLPAACPL